MQSQIVYGLPVRAVKMGAKAQPSNTCFRDAVRTMKEWHFPDPADGDAVPVIKLGGTFVELGIEGVEIAQVNVVRRRC